MVVIYALKSLAVAGCVVMDRIRGDDEARIVSKAVESFLYGLVVAFLAGVTGYLPVLAFAVAFAVGASPGWGDPMGAYLRGGRTGGSEWWQVWMLATDTRAAVIGRGLVWAIPVTVAVAIIGAGEAAILPIAAAFPLSLWLAKRWPFKVPFLTGQPWHTAESLRGLIIGLGTVALASAGAL